MDMDVKERLDELRAKYNTPQFIDNDPVQFAHRYSRLQDIEIVSFIIATISWGKRPMILKSAERILNIMGESPYDYIMSEGYHTLQGSNLHRTFFETDLRYYAQGLHDIYQTRDSLEELFTNESSLWEGISAFRQAVADANFGVSTKHISNPDKGSACKRLFMGLRWLVRRDGIVDLGVWKNISPSELYIPLDTHVARVSRELGLLDRKVNDRTAVELLTENLKKLDAEDPISYDFALFGWGEDRQNS